MSELNGESLHNWIHTEQQRAILHYYDAADDAEEAFYAGVLSTLEILQRKLRTGQVKPLRRQESG
ncbi:hypothetical protein [Bradyrhizobium sp.]